MSLLNQHVLVAAEKYHKDLEDEIRFRKNLKYISKESNIFWVQGEKQNLWWPQWILWSVQEQTIDSIGHAAKILKSKGKYWLPLDFKFHRRSTLIQENLPKIKNPNIERGTIPPQKHCGAWFLKDNNILCYSQDISLPFPNGIIPIPEDKKAPSRAFNKLDEVFVRIRSAPLKNQRVLDLGSHPGGWTWVLSHYAHQVISVDTVPLDAKLNSVKNIQFIKKDAFKLEPSEIGPIDWLMSDIICEPVRLFALVELWRSSGLVKNFVCSIKFKGQVDFDLVGKFEKIPGSQIFHMNANKHELTWVNLA